MRKISTDLYFGIEVTSYISKSFLLISKLECFSLGPGLSSHGEELFSQPFRFSGQAL
jgi:hypothetical protein